jgi:hypothetical protein
MSLIAHAISLVAQRRWRRFERACADPAAAQAAVLGGLLRKAAATELGRELGFGELRTPEEFRRRVPVTPYEQAAKLWHRAFDGARDVAWPGHVPYFALSSGTTAGNKLLPVTRDAVRSNFSAGTLLTAVLARRGGAEALAGGKLLYLGGCTSMRRRGTCLIGDASGFVARHIPFYVRRRHLPEPDIAAIANWQEKIDRVVDRYLTADVATLSACPSWAALLFKQMLQTAGRGGRGERTIGELWPKLTFFVSYGMAFEPYRAAFEQYVGRAIHYVDTYSSSEAGMSAVQDEPGGPMRLIVDNGVFYEFIPAGQADAADPPRLHLGEVTEGVDYAVVLSSNGGIWAYPLGDVVRFVSLRPPRIVFAGRTAIYLSAFGEHVTLGMIEQAVAAACRATGAIVADYTIAPRWPAPAQPRPAHRWLVEFDRPPATAEQFTAALDASIRAENEDYDTHRTDDYGLAPPILIPVAKGTFYEWMKRQGKLGGQNKVPRVARTPEAAEKVLEISRELGNE